MLREYQDKAVNEIRELYKNGAKKILLHLATGGGKTVVFCHILKQMHQKNNPAIMVVRGRKLVDQASQRLIRENIDHGVFMAGHWNMRPSRLIQVCSIDTLRARKHRPPAKLIVIDEAHLMLSEKDKEFVESYPDAKILAVTATPYSKKSMRHLADEIVCPITIRELIDQGHLVPCITYAPPVGVDLSQVPVSKMTGDYQEAELSAVMSDKVLVGDVVKHWKEFGQDRPSICFATGVKHSKLLCEEFLANGVPAAHVDASSSDKERNEILKRLERGEIKVITNCGILSIGVDMPYVGCIIGARPTKSLNLYIQQTGRGTRPCPEIGKKDFILLDHAGNVLEFGLITDEHPVNLDGKQKKTDPELKTCQVCFAVFVGFGGCPHGCVGEVKEKKKAAIITSDVDAKLKLYVDNPEEMRILKEIFRLQAVQKKKGYKRGWIYYKLAEIFPMELVEKHFPKREVPAWVRNQINTADVDSEQY